MKIDDADLSNSLSATKILMATRFPLCYSLVQNCEVVFTDSPRIKTAAITPDDTIYVNPDFWKELSFMQRVFLLSHEVFHPAFGYFYRSAGLVADRANRAHDYVINLMLDELIRDGFIARGLLDTKYAGLSFEEVYARLKGGDGPGSSSGQKSQGGGGETSEGQSYGESGLRNDAMPVDVIGEGKGAYDAPDSGNDGTPTDQTGKSTDDLKEKAFQWQQRLYRAYEFNAMQGGSLPASIKTQIESHLVSKVSWEDRLHCAMGEIMGKVKSDYNRMNRRASANFSDLAYPAERFRQMDVAVYVDTSGSISKSQLERGFAEIEEICRQTNGRVRFLEGDAAIHRDEYISELPDDLTGGGGTSFAPVFEHLDSFPEKTKAIVIFTDTWGAMPDFEPNLQVVWAVYSECAGSGVKVPFGEVIEIPPDIE